jgi:hypothetical protein
MNACCPALPPPPLAALLQWSMHTVGLHTVFHPSVTKSHSLCQGANSRWSLFSEAHEGRTFDACAHSFCCLCMLAGMQAFARSPLWKMWKFVVSQLRLGLLSNLPPSTAAVETQHTTIWSATPRQLFKGLSNCTTGLRPVGLVGCVGWLVVQASGLVGCAGLAIPLKDGSWLSSPCKAKVTLCVAACCVSLYYTMQPSQVTVTAVKGVPLPPTGPLQCSQPAPAHPTWSCTTRLSVKRHFTAT